ncbi:MAG: chromosome segregation protein SMC, partial [Clostridiales bacterium]|nr:chromosome segregation protein SMC [Clostridiales bacterium]
MLLKKLEIYGFKSFADRIYMKFDKGITAIVGPNGSGKSNIADAVRWVLGEQSAKSLRGSKMEDIIFSGTQVRKSLGFAEVSLTLDNFDGALPVEYAEVTVTRRVFRSGESEYFINRSACRLRDIVELFMDTGVGKEGYSIIGQGRIDEILSTRSEDRRYIFEEAAGIVKYKSRRDESEKKLEKTRENLIRVEDILSELKQQLGPLEEQSHAAKEYLQLKEQLKTYEINQFLFQYSRHNERIEELKGQIIQLEGEAESRKNQTGLMESNRDSLSEKLSDLQRKADKARTERYDLLNASEKIKGEQNLNRERIRQFERDNNRLLEEIARKEQDIKEVQENLNVLGGTVKDRRLAFEEKKEKAELLLENLNQLNKEISDHQQHINETKGDIIHVLQQMSDCKSQLTRYHTMESSWKSRLDKIKELTDDKDHQRESLFQLKKSLHKKVMSTKRRLETEKTQRTSLADTVREEKQALYTQEDLIQKEKQALEGKRSRLRLLEDMRKGYDGFYKTVKEILTACQSNPVISDKVCGVVASLIQVPEEYETAIETVLGSSLQHIVTEDEEDAKYLISYLRKNNYGRATFLPVSSIKGRRMSLKERDVINMEGCRGIASEQVSCDPKYQGILDSLLGRVVIADDMDAAVRMARRFTYSFRIVTLQGDMVNPGGSMTGGSNAARSISILGRKREIGELQTEIAERQEVLAKTESKRQEELIAYREQKENLETIEATLRELEQNLASGEESLNGVSNQVDQAEKELSTLGVEREQIKQNLESLSTSIEVTNNELQDLESKNADINETAAESEAFLSERQVSRDLCSKEQTDIRVQVAAMQQEILNLKEQGNRIQEDLRRHFDGIKAREQQRKSNDKEIESINKTIDDEMVELASMESRASELKASMEEAEKNRASLEERLKEIEKELREWSQTTADITDRKYKLEVQCSRYEIELENFQNKVWEEYELTWQTAMPFKDESLTITNVNQQIQTLKKGISDLGVVNVNAIEDFKRVSERYEFLSEQRNDLVMAKDNLRDVIKEITTTMMNRFQEEFTIINQCFGVTFRELFGGGHAQLVLEDPEDILNCGIEIVAQPPGKKLQSLSLLSG